MEYVFLLGLAGLIVVLAIVFRPAHRESVMRHAINEQRILDAKQARSHREFQHVDTPPKRTEHFSRAELIGAFVSPRKKKKAEAWAQIILNDGGSVWMEGGAIWYKDASGTPQTYSFEGDWD